MKPLVDPEFDDIPRPQSGECPRGRCDGSGWIRVSQEYVDFWYPLHVEADYPPAATDAYRAWMDEQRRLKRASAANTSYPCPVCQPVQFDRWNGGHWEQDHNRAACPACVAAIPELRAGGGRRRRRNREESHAPDPVYTGPDEDPPPPALPIRLDVDG